jgi:hypothetical protein
MMKFSTESSYNKKAAPELLGVTVSYVSIIPG